MEKFYLSKALLKLAGGGDASPTSPSWIRPCLGLCTTKLCITSNPGSGTMVLERLGL